MQKEWYALNFDTHFGQMCLFCVVLVVMLYDLALNVVMVYDSTGIYVELIRYHLDWWYDIQSKFLQFYGGYVLPIKSVL